MKALVNTEKLQLIPPDREPLPAVIQITERTEANLKIAPVNSFRFSLVAVKYLILLVWNWLMKTFFL